MTAVAQQRTKEWHEARKGKITGSRVGAALGLNPFMSPEQLLEELIRELNGEPPSFTGNEATRWGELHEPMALRAYRNRTRKHVANEGFVPHREHAFIGYSPDGVVKDVKVNGAGVVVESRAVGVLEIKCPYSQYIPEELPPHYYAQVQLGMEVLDVEQCDFFYWTPKAIQIRNVTRDRDWWESAFPKLEAFNKELQRRRNYERV